MKAVAWHGNHDVRVDTVEDPRIEQPTDAIVRVTSTGICGSDLHLYEVLGAFIDAGDILGHEPMGIVEEVGADVTHIQPGDRVVIPFNIACGSCWKRFCRGPIAARLRPKKSTGCCPSPDFHLRRRANRLFARCRHTRRCGRP